MTTSMRLPLLLAFLSASVAAAAEVPAAPEFFIKESASTKKDDVGFDLTLQLTYRLTARFVHEQYREQLVPVLKEQGLTDFYPVTTESTPLELFRARGSLAGLKPGEALQLYIAGYAGSASGTDGTRVSVAPSGDGLWRANVVVDNKPAVETNEPRQRPPNLSLDAEFVRTPKGAVIWFRYVESPGAAGTYINSVGVGTNLLPSPEQWRKAFVFTLTNDDLLKLTQVQRTNTVHLVDSGTNETDLNVTSELRFTKPPVEGDVKVDAEKYESWVPEGNLEAPSKAGNNLVVKVSVAKKGSAAPTPARFDVTLLKVSHERGVCMNYPLKTAEASDGLKLRATGGNVEVLAPDHARTKDLALEAAFTVDAFDFGAYGVVHVVATDAAGAPLKVTVRGKETPDLTLPMDENHNHIADDWEKKYAGGLGGQETDDDDATPTGKHPGDGLSRYEEYRGFRVSGPEPTDVQMVKGQHVRTDPRVKDLFVCDRSEGQSALVGVRHFAASTHVRVHELAPDALAADRSVNTNLGLGNVVLQHGVVFVGHADRGNDDPIALLVDPKDARFGPPALTLEVRLPHDMYLAGGEGMADVAHELGHTVGLPHHGDENMLPVTWTWKAMKDGTHQWFERDVPLPPPPGERSKPLPPAMPVKIFYEPPEGSAQEKPFLYGDDLPGAALQRDGSLMLWVGGPKSGWSGDQECIMRYADKQAFIARDDPSKRYIPDSAQWNMRRRLCDSSEGTGVNASTHKPQPRYGDAALGNCQGRLVISDKYRDER